MGIETAREDVIRPRLRSRDLDRRIAEFARHQHGVVARRQLLADGACPRAIGRRIERGTLWVVHPAVYAFRHRLLTERGQAMAGALAGGDGAAIRHVSGARLWELPIGPRAPLHVTTQRHRHPYPDITFHHAVLPPDELTVVDAIPLTTVARTLFDVASEVPRHRLRALISEAEYRQLTDVIALPHLIERYPRHRGVAVMRGILAERGLGQNRTREELEALFREFLIERDIPRPGFNQPMTVGGLRIVADCVWTDQRVIVELDGVAAHARRGNFESDRKRDRMLLVAGWRPTRVTWWQLTRDADGLERELRALLAETAVSDG